MTTEHAAVREAARRLSGKDSAARDGARGGTPVVRAYAHWGAAEDGKGKARQRSLRWMELGWEGTTTAAREEARKEAILEMLRALVEDSRRGVQVRVFVTRWEAPWQPLGSERGLRGWAKPTPLARLTASALPLRARKRHD
jgi:hypothetical protein